jgi:hypothetical protein
MLAAYSNSNQTNWDLYLPLVLFAYRTSTQATTGESPFALLYGREPRLGDLDNFNIGYQPSKFVEELMYRWKEAKDKISRQAEISKEYYDKKYGKEPTKYKENDLVRIKQPQTKIGLKKKLRNDLYSEPVRISKVLSDQNVEVEVRNRKKVVNVDNIKKKEVNRTEMIRTEPIITRYGRVSNPRML